MTIADVSTTPSGYAMLVTWSKLLDFTAVLESGATIESVTTSLFDLNTGTGVELSDTPFFDGNLIFQWVRGPLTTPPLQSNHRYRLTVDYTDSGGETNGGVLMITAFQSP